MCKISSRLIGFPASSNQSGFASSHSSLSWMGILQLHFTQCHASPFGSVVPQSRQSHFTRLISTRPYMNSRLHFWQLSHNSVITEPTVSRKIYFRHCHTDEFSASFTVNGFAHFGLVTPLRRASSLCFQQIYALSSSSQQPHFRYMRAFIFSCP